MSRFGSVRPATVKGALFALCACLLGAQAAVAQLAERRAYTMSEGMRRDLEARQFDAGQIEGIVNGVEGGLARGDLKPILDEAAPMLRITAGTANDVVKKDRLSAFKARLMADVALRRDVLDEQQFVLKGDEVGLARGAIWIGVQCLDDDCTKKKSAIVTINVP